MENDEALATDVTRPMPPITDRQALNVARHVLFTVLNASALTGGTDKVLRSLHDEAQPEGSDVRAAYAILDRLCELHGWDWKIG